ASRSFSSSFQFKLANSKYVYRNILAYGIDRDRLKLDSVTPGRITVWPKTDPSSGMITRKALAMKQKDSEPNRTAPGIGESPSQHRTAITRRHFLKVIGSAVAGGVGLAALNACSPASATSSTPVPAGATPAA